MLRLITPLSPEDNRFTQKQKRNVDDAYREEGTTKHPYEHKHNPRYTAGAFIVPIVCS